MPNTYTQIHIHLIFAVKFRKAQIHKIWKERLHQYLTGIIQGNNHKVLQIESMPDWAQTLAWINPVTYMVEVMRMVLLKGAGLNEIWPHLKSIAIGGLILNGLAVWSYRKRS